jgi:hypothetical protein
MCKNSAAMTGSCMGCGSGNYSLILMTGMFYFVTGAGKNCGSGTVCKLFRSSMRSRCAEREIAKYSGAAC